MYYEWKPLNSVLIHMQKSPFIIFFFFSVGFSIVYNTKQYEIPICFSLTGWHHFPLSPFWIRNFFIFHCSFAYAMSDAGILKHRWIKCINKIPVFFFVTGYPACRERIVIYFIECSMCSLFSRNSLYVYSVDCKPFNITAEPERNGTR